MEDLGVKDSGKFAFVSESVSPIAITRSRGNNRLLHPGTPWPQPGRAGCAQAGGSKVGGYDVSFACIRK